MYKTLILYNEIGRKFLSRGASLAASVQSLLRSSLPSTSLDSLQNPPPHGELTIRNAYIPLNRPFLFRELVQDSSIINPSERENFEKIYLLIQEKFALQFRLLERELAVLFQPATLHSSPDELEQVTRFISSDNAESGTPHYLRASERRDREFWLIRRLSRLAHMAGFVEVPYEHVEHAFCTKRFDRESASLFVDPRDYDTIRFWIRGIHSRSVKVAPGAAESDPLTLSRPDVLSRISDLMSRPMVQFYHTLHQVYRVSFARLLSLSGKALKLNDPFSSSELCFTNVLMAVRTVKDTELLLKLYDSAPASKPSKHSNFTDSLSLLLPIIRFHPLTTTGRTLIAASCLTAFACLGVVAPLAWLLTSSPDLVIAWSAAASSTAGVTACLVWARYWRSRAKAANHLRQMQFNCIRSSGYRAVLNLLQLAVDEELKAAVLCYALLLRPSEAGVPLSPVALGIRAESWILKRLSPESHLSPDWVQNPVGSSKFMGKPGPPFEVTFEPSHPLELLRRLGLVHGQKNHPQAIPVDAAAAALDTESESGRGLSSLWVEDPIFDEAFKSQSLE